jgi:hypothetical protein
LKLRPHAEDGADRLVAIDRLEGLVCSVPMVVDEPGLAAIDRHHRAAAVRIAYKKRSAAVQVADQRQDAGVGLRETFH